MKVTINRENNSVVIQGDFTGPYLKLELSPSEARSLLQCLEDRREEIRDMAQNYYDCRDCGNTHPNSMLCPIREVSQ